MTGQPELKLKGVRVLLVEDSFLVAASISRMLEDLGCKVVGPVARVEEALEIVRETGCDAGILDVNLGVETSERVATEFLNRQVPFLFVTGYMSPPGTDPKFTNFRRLHKPLTEVMLADALLLNMNAVTDRGKPAPTTE